MPSLDSVVTELGALREHVRPVAREIAERWVLYFIWGAPGRGTGDHARGLALDFMTYELGDGVDDPGPRRDWIGHQIAAYVLANRKRLSVTYLIWNGRIASAASNPPWSWRAYTGSNPHIDHVHVSFRFTGIYTPPPTPEDDDMITTEDVENIAQRAAQLVWDEHLDDEGAWDIPSRKTVVGISGKGDASKQRDIVILNAIAAVMTNLGGLDRELDDVRAAIAALDEEEPPA
jgi:hypothetical protein